LLPYALSSTSNFESPHRKDPLDAVRTATVGGTTKVEEGMKAQNFKAALDRILEDAQRHSHKSGHYYRSKCVGTRWHAIPPIPTIEGKG
jgi:hypothetical protein